MAQSSLAQSHAPQSPPIDTIRKDCPSNFIENKIYDILGERYKQIRKTYFYFLTDKIASKFMDCNHFS